MDLQTMRANVYTLLMEREGETLATTEVNRLLNVSQDNIQDHIDRSYDKHYLTTQVRDTAVAEAYEFPTDMKIFKNLEILVDGKYRGCDIIDIDQREGWRDAITNFKVRQMFYVKDKYFGLIPVPISVITSGLRITYVRRITDLSTDTQSSEIPVDFHMLIVMDTVNLIKAALNEPPMFQRKFDTMLQELIDHVSPRLMKKPKQVKMVEGTYSGV